MSNVLSGNGRALWLISNMHVFIPHPTLSLICPILSSVDGQLEDPVFYEG